MMKSSASRKGKKPVANQESDASRKLQAATCEALSAARSLERELKQQQSANEAMQHTLEGRHRAASDSLARAERLVAALEKPGDLWGLVASDVARLGDGKGKGKEKDDLVKALEESSAICERFIAHGGDAELVKRIDEVIEMLGGD